MHLPRLARPLCLLRGHAPADKPVWNQGWHFGRCRGCGEEIVRRSRKWRLVPAGYRVVWRPRPADHPDWEAASRRFAAQLRERALAELRCGAAPQPD